MEVGGAERRGLGTSPWGGAGGMGQCHLLRVPHSVSQVFLAEVQGGKG